MAVTDSEISMASNRSAKLALAISAGCLLACAIAFSKRDHTRAEPRDATDPAPVSVLEKYKVARGYIEHENGLVAARIGWFLTTQGFLFTAFFLAAQIPWRMKSGFSGDSLTYIGVVGAVAVAILGMTTAWLVQILLQLALEELARVQLWSAHWQPDDRSLPKIVRETRGLTADKFAWVFVIVWGVLLTAFVLAFLHSAWRLGLVGGFVVLLAIPAALVFCFVRRQPTGWIPLELPTESTGCTHAMSPRKTLDVDVIPVSGLAYTVVQDVPLRQYDPSKRTRKTKLDSTSAVTRKKTSTLRKGMRVKVDMVCRIAEKAGDASKKTSIWAHVARLPD